ncbi:MAG: hypothetical protein UU21_C0005G0016 [Candidatus Levybacteria bacterium GW2011_GWA2_40_8]|nr:MAG: hypothetical protein UU21_C0005G0016 [Candidatus Levybacteria bacterium GW2011_GWA2_40_8]
MRNFETSEDSQSHRPEESFYGEINDHNGKIVNKLIPFNKLHLSKAENREVIRNV